MSQQACQALGYTSSNGTLLLQEPASRSERRPKRAGHPARDSLWSMLHLGARHGCEPAGQPHWSVFLQCNNFQCGRSVTSHLSRLVLAQDQAQATESALRSALSSAPTAQPLSSSSRPQLVSRHPGPLLPAQSQAMTRGLPRVPADEDEEEQWPQEAEEEEQESAQEAGPELEAHARAGAGLAEGPPLVRARTAAAARGRALSARMVVGGTESMPGEFPYLAALHGGPDEVFFCGGVLIDANWLLTAAHCVGNRTQPEGWMVKVGVTRRIASPAFVRKLRVRKIIKHPDFNRAEHLNNDIALILLDESVEFNQYLRPVCLPERGLQLGPDSSRDCVVVGFGKSKFSQDANYLPVAHFVSVPIISTSTCSSWYAEEGVSLTEGMICAGYSEGKRDACQVSRSLEYILESCVSSRVSLLLNFSLYLPFVSPL